MGTFESIFLISLAIIIMIFQNIFFGLFNIYVIKEHETSLQRLLNILYFLLALVIQVSWLDNYKSQPETRKMKIENSRTPILCMFIFRLDLCSTL